MQSSPPSTDYDELSVAEKILNLQDAWDSIASNPETISMTEAQRKELDSRIEAMEKNPGTGIPWNTAKNNLRKPR